LSKSDILLGAILRTCERNRHLEDSQRRQGLRRRRAESENPSGQYNHLLDPLDPLDLSFETSKDWSEDDEEVNYFIICFSITCMINGCFWGFLSEKSQGKKGKLQK
jgi:hypothetical protein